ncbi:MAG: glutamine--fructose-6-phosphate transaminase (isomerizing), partial [Oxalobacteraceae bacterium]
AMLAMLGRLRGSYAIAIMLRHHPAMMMAARSGPPLAIGHGRGEMFFGSDAIALASFTDRITYLDNGDCAVITRDSALIFDFQGHPVVRPHRVVQTAAYLADKGNHRHFMEKEIAEQPETISHLLGNYIDFASRTVKVDHDIDFSSISGLLISGCGTAYLSGCIGKYWFERHAGIVVETDYASEFRYRDVPFFPRQAALFISQSGETADTLAALHYCIENGVMTGAVVNVAESTLGRDADALFPTLAGPEIGVASTKAFTCQLAVLACLAVAAGRARGTIDAVQEASMVGNLIEVPRLMGEVLTKMRPHVEDLAAQIAQCRNILYIGRGTSFPLAMEGALKLKEITYIHAEGYAAGELKHGPIALVDEAMPVVVIAPFDRFFEKTVSNMQEVAARGGRIILITDERGAAQSSLPTMGKIVLPDMEEFISPILFALPLQMLAYHTAAIMGTDVDQPRNLAKSVTVE